MPLECRDWNHTPQIYGAWLIVRSIALTLLHSKWRTLLTVFVVNCVASEGIMSTSQYEVHP